MFRAGAISLKRRFDELPPDTLILQPSSDRPAKKLHFVREGLAPGNHDGEHNISAPAGLSVVKASQSTPPSERRIRTFHLKHGTAPSVNRKSRGTNTHLPTFVEDVTHEDRGILQDKSMGEDALAVVDVSSASTLKRPGRGAAIRTPSKQALSEISETDQEQLQELARYIHQVEEVEMQRQVPPIISRTRKTSNAQRKTEPDNEQYVYDTYILTTSAQDGAMQADTQLESTGDVGYLVISEGDEDLWEELDGIDEEDYSDRDDADENAEDYYGADYPEDELVSDDEYDRNVYGFRNHGGSDDEDWNVSWAYENDDSAVHSFERGAVGRFAKYLRPEQNEGVMEDASD